MKVWTYNIDLVGGCNLQCPSCPVGNADNSNRKRGFMTLERFEQILLKIKRETPHLAHLGLYNWAEPTLHPELPEFIRLANKHGVPVSLSTNLNYRADYEEILLARPASLRISLSGFTQANYGITHAKGNIQRVKEHMRLLSNLRAKHGIDTYIDVTYHCYRTNLGEDYEHMKALCKELGFAFAPVFAYYMPIEKLISYYENGPSSLSAQDKEVMEKMAVHPDEYPLVSRMRKPRECELKSSRIAINWDGSVALCCATFDSKYTVARDFLSTPIEQIQAAKDQQEICEKCGNYNLHNNSVYVNGWNWVRASRKRVDKLPKELIRSHLLMQARQVLIGAFGPALVDGAVRLIRRPARNLRLRTSASSQKQQPTGQGPA